MDFKNRTLFLGVDPSFNTMGICVYDPVENTFQLFTGEFLECVAWLNRKKIFPKIIAVVENPNLDKTTFKMWGMMKALILKFQTYTRWIVSRRGQKPEEVGIEDLASAFRVSMNYAQKVGKNKAAAELIIKMLKNAGVPCMEIAPSKRERADKYKKINKAKIRVETLKMPTKTDQEQFRTLTGYTGSSSEHARDAATLVYGRKLRWAYLHFHKQAGGQNEELLHLVEGSRANKIVEQKRKLPF
jgi:hypothetical protein